MNDGFTAEWRNLGPAGRRALEVQYEGLFAGGLACGAVITDAGGHVVAEGRNRAYDPPGGSDALQGTPLAHAELNALAAARTEWDFGSCTLLTTQQPCAMCAAALTFIGMGRVRYVAPDPWAIATGQADPAGAEPLRDHRWAVAANTVFLASIALRAGRDHPTVRRNRDLEPETVEVMDRVLDSPLPETFTAFGAAEWTHIAAAGATRQARLRP